MRRHLLVPGIFVLVLGFANVTHPCVGGTPKTNALSVSNCPNPFNPWTTVTYTVPSRGDVTVAIYDISGARVITLVREEKGAGAHSIEWNGRSASGSLVRSGVYFLRIDHGGAARTAKMVVLK